ncbi:MAG: hypothetical protein KC613_12935 [Myxococcales bacterium]|nr:hypothetical protein [Myxococcales bacterium]MCB9526420.1 hypothetical protein [Myxococcales bacterium]
MRHRDGLWVAALAFGLWACGDKGGPAQPAAAGASAPASATPSAAMEAAPGAPASAALSPAEVQAAKDSITADNAEAEAEKLLAEIEADDE